MYCTLVYEIDKEDTWMKKARTILAVLLAVLMVLSILPASLAEGSKKLDREGEAAAFEQSGRKLPSKSEKSDKMVTKNYALEHLKIGIDSLKQLINKGWTVKHLRFDYY